MTGSGTPSRQPTAPYLDALVAYGFRGPTRFHVPGHKGGSGADPGLRWALGERALLLDVPQDTEGIDVGPEPTPYAQAEELAAAAYGAEQSWFLTNGATQGNHALCLALAGPGTRVVLQRNAHASLIDGLVLSGGMPAFVAPETDDELGMAHGVTPDALRAALQRAPDARAVFVVSPTYYGMCADVAGLAEVAHAAGAVLVVDQAWGPHFGFHPGVPQSGLALGADAVITSTHKIVGALTQAAMLHVAGGRDGVRVDTATVGRAVRLVRSTSPSSLLLASLDAARRQMAVHGQALLAQTLAAAAQARAAIDALPGCAVVGERLVGRPGVAAWDPLRLVIDVRGTGCTGYDVSAALRAGSDIHVELATHATLVLVLGVHEQVEALERLVHDLGATVAEITRPIGPAQAPVVRAPVLGSELAVPPRDAFLGETEVVAVDAALGRVSCEAIAGYPPGIPALLPGERIREEVVAYLRELAVAGARLHGASDPSFETITVLRDAA
ncbi:MAG TPA: aminotransferase class I/II-fold pyridoxal phosphate-dependent enzyme [Conexibacter sp.]|jgi:lysine decarboxylase|nr:aminotransferase class I/II-fold pyridoxal phosphate-dependent enzyme [Conexibacter sp.]